METKLRAWAARKGYAVVEYRGALEIATLECEHCRLRTTDYPSRFVLDPAACTSPTCIEHMLGWEVRQGIALGPYTYAYAFCDSNGTCVVADRREHPALRACAERHGFRFVPLDPADAALSADVVARVQSAMQ